MHRSPNLRARLENGFSIIEVVISMAFMTLLMGAVFSLLWSVQVGYTREKQVAEMNQNQRYALEHISRILRRAGNNPEGLMLSSVVLDPDGNAAGDDVRIQSDFNPADGDILDDGEDVYLRLVGTELRFRNGPPGAAETVLCDGITGIHFSAFDFMGNATSDPVLISRVAVTLSARTSWEDLQRRVPGTRTLTTSVQLRK